MARVPEIIRTNPISQVAARPAQRGQGYAALSELASLGAEIVEPAALDEARQSGEKAVYRDEDGKLKVDDRSLLGGKMSMVHNSAAYAKYLGQKQIDISQTFTELAIKHQFDPAGFKEATDAYTALLKADEDIPSVLKEDLVLNVQTEAARRFNGLHRAEVQRNYHEADVNTKTSRDMMVEDYVSLYMEGDDEAAAAKWEEIEGASKFRADAPYITETPAETEAFMRGARGTAKAARMIRDLGDLEGATEISDEKRAELIETLNDEDLSPSVRQKLYSATHGRLKGIDAASIVTGMTDNSYEAMVVRSESSGNNSAANPNSSALGPHQFTKGTWSGLVKKYKPDWAKGLSDGQISALRTDRSKSTEMFQHFRSENAAVLRSAGIPINPATEYLAHFFGAGTAAKVLSSDPTKAVSEIVTDQVIKANPFLARMSVQDAQNWAARKMTLKASDLAGMAVNINAIEDPEVRAMASKQLANQIRVRKAIEDAAFATYQERIASSDDTLTQQEIVEDHDLSSADQLSLSKALGSQRKKQNDLVQTVTNLNDPEFRFNRFDAKERNGVNDVYVQSLEGEDPLSSAEHMRTATQINNKTGYVPQAMYDSIRAAVKSNDPARLATAMEYSDKVLQENPAAFDPYGGNREVLSALSDYKFYAEFNDAESAANTLIEQNTPEAKAKRKNLSDAAKEAAKDLNISDIQNHFDDAWLSNPDMGSDLEQDEMMSEYQLFFKDEYIKTGDPALAKNRALDQLGRIYSPNMVTGRKRVMKFPPNITYPTVDGSHDWMRDQVEREISTLVYGDKAWKPKGGIAAVAEFANPQWVDHKQIKLMSDSQTRDEFMQGKPASYVLYYMKDGLLEQAPQRYVFDPKRYQADLKKEQDAARQKFIDDEVNYQDNFEAMSNERNAFIQSLQDRGNE